MFTFIKKFFDYNQKEIERIQKTVVQINDSEDQIRNLKDQDFKKKTEQLKKEIREEKKTLEEILPLSFALVREAARRTLGERHFDVQLVAGIALHEGKVAEQKTGEGKTLSATTAMYLNALKGDGVHLVTVNDYLARRDAGWMGAVFHFLGLSTSAIISDQSFLYDPGHSDKNAQDWRLAHLKPVSRGQAYEADITYGINSEFGFDYLRDNMAQNREGLVQRGFNFAIIDEADSVLIDEARTPHIISAPYEEDTSKYYTYAEIVKQLDPKEDYTVDEKIHTANLTENGIRKIESILKVDNIYEKDFDALFHIEAALKANTLFRLDKDYIVKDGEVIIVDEFTGRLLHGRRFSEGLHQAIEAKERVQIQRESKTLATVSLQNYFRMYKKLSGMTGTASTEAEEFNKIYHADVLVVPTHRPMVRKDHPDMIYKTEGGKFNAVVEEIADNYKKGRPVLVGTTSIEKNEHLSRQLAKRGIPHELLNAKNHLMEAHIIAQAGKKHAVTVATNMAGRGVDIILGGAPPNKYEMDKKEYEEAKKIWQSSHDEIVALGGLLVIGTERHESRRIDNQLRGRSGRQGDPGETRFFVALEDDLMRIFGGEQISRLMTFFNLPEDQPLTHSMVSKAIEQAQVKVEGFNFDIRKHLVDFDDVLNKQRDIIYTLRKKILLLPETNKEEFHETVLDATSDEISSLVASFTSIKEVATDEDTDRLIKDLNVFLPIEKKEVLKHFDPQNSEELVTFLIDSVETFYKAKGKKIGEQLWMEVVRSVYLSTIDTFWTEHLTAIEDLREGINLRGYAQLDPLVEYKNEAFSMFERLIGNVHFEATRRIFRVEVQAVPREQQKEESPLVYKSASSTDPFTQPAQAPQAGAAQLSEQMQPAEEIGFKIIPPGTKQRKLGRNDPCWCGAKDPSGKPYKYKKCGLINASYHKG